MLSVPAATLKEARVAQGVKRVRPERNQWFKTAAINWAFDRDEFATFTEQVWPSIDRVPGYLRRLESFYLYHTAKTLKGVTRHVDQPSAQAVVEVGSYKGRSSVAIGLGLKHNPNGQFTLYCVDPFFDDRVEKGLADEFHANITRAGVADIIKPVAQYSADAARDWPRHQGIAMLWIDGNHEYEYVRDDFLSWSRFLVPRGVVAFHDWQFVGIREALTECLFTREAYQDVCVMNGNLVAARKIDGRPTRRQLAAKRRVYWALQVQSANPWVALVGMLHHKFIRTPLGNLRSFFGESVGVQQE